MTPENLITLSKHEVRNNNAFMLLYLQEFENIFGRKPNCASCTFNHDWEKFINASKSQNIKIKTMATDSKYKLANNHMNTILTYVEDGRPVRTYGYKMTDEFAEKFLSTGTKKQIEDRKKLFTSQPKDNSKSFELEGEKINLDDATGKKLTAYADAKGIDLSDARLVADKRAVVAKTL